jgi:hypothetical protein
MENRLKSMSKSSEAADAEGASSSSKDEIIRGLNEDLARYLSALGTTYHLPLTIDTELYVISLSAHDSIDQSFSFVVNWQ